MNDQEREQWINNDEGLYLEWRRSRKGITTFIRENRQEIDLVIDSILNKEPLS